MLRPLRILLFGGVLWGGAAMAAGLPVVSIIIDDLGYQLEAGRQAVDLPGNLTCAFLPHAPYARELAERAHRRHKEVMLHLPMQSDNGKRLGPGGLTVGQTERVFKQTLHRSLASIPHVRGFNNHMGSTLTRDRDRMRWLMQSAMFRSDLYFVDSRTTADTVAEDEARRHGIAVTRRDIFLDYEKDAAIVEEQLASLIRLARDNGTAVAIGHPYPRTLATLRTWLPTLAEEGIRLVPVSTVVRIRQSQQPKRNSRWQLSLSPSPMAAKNSKP